MTISRQPPVMSIRYMFRLIGIKRVTIVRYERSLVDLEVCPVPDGLSFLQLDHSNFEDLLGKGLLPDSHILAFEGMLFKRTYAEQKRRAFDEIHRRLFRNDACFVGIHDGRPVGWVWVCRQEEKYEPAIEATLHFGPRSSIIYHLHVYPEYQRRGYALALCQQAMLYQGQSGIDTAVATVESDNVPSRNTFERLGFRPTTAYRRTRVFNHSKITEGTYCTIVASGSSKAR